MTDAPDTVTDAVALLRAEGYELELDVRECAGAEMERSFRFEGESDPGDETIVVGVHFPGSDRRGVLVSAYGYDTEPEEAEILRRLVDKR